MVLLWQHEIRVLFCVQTSLVGTGVATARSVLFIGGAFIVSLLYSGTGDAAKQMFTDVSVKLTVAEVQ